MSNKLIVTGILGLAMCSWTAYSKEPAKGRTDGEFLAMAAQADMTIAHLGKDAEDRGANDKIKDFGKTLVSDHTSDYQTLSELAATTGDAIPKAIDRSNDRTIMQLDRYKGKTFDHAFLERQSEEHARLVHAFKEEAEHGTNPEIKAYATKTLPTIERHLHDANDLLKEHA